MTEDGTWQIVPLLCKHESTSKTNILNKWKDQLLDFLLPKNYNSCNTLTDVDEVSYANPGKQICHTSQRQNSRYNNGVRKEVYYAYPVFIDFQLFLVLFSYCLILLIELWTTMV